ncbi:hypothetical protein D3C86_2073050 [compost metagenome]
MIMATAISRADSPRNCTIMAAVPLPVAFRIPTSFARLNDEAIWMLIKLMLAISNMKPAIPAKM